jgi:hypothetical protein
MKFEDLVGQTIPMVIPLLDREVLHEVKIHGVEAGGIWIESEFYSKYWINKLGVAAIRTPIFFVPYHEIRLAMHSLEKLELSEKKFGL